MHRMMILVFKFNNISYMNSCRVKKFIKFTVHSIFHLFPDDVDSFYFSKKNLSTIQLIAHIYKQ